MFTHFIRNTIAGVAATACLLAYPAKSQTDESDRLQKLEQAVRIYPDYADARSYSEITVPARSFFVLGDHRTMSNDSRDFGPVNERFIYGKAVFGYWPMEKVGRLR